MIVTNWKIVWSVFDLENWKTVITSGEDWMIILSLVLIECLLSVDNAIVLAAQTQKLPDKVQQEKSLFYGLWGAYVFRFIMIGLGAYLINFGKSKFLARCIWCICLWTTFGRCVIRNRFTTGRKRAFSNFAALLVRSRVDRIDGYGLFDWFDFGFACSFAKSSHRFDRWSDRYFVYARNCGSRHETDGNLARTWGYGIYSDRIDCGQAVLTIPMIDIEIPAALFGGIVLASLAVTVVVHKIRN